MECQKITNLLGITLNEVPIFLTKKLVEVHDQSGSAENRYKPSKKIRFKASILRSDLCNFRDAYIVVKGDVTLTKTDGRRFTDIRNRFLAFQNNTSITNCISKINNVLIDNAEDLDVVMSMYSLIEYSKNYRKTTKSLWNSYTDEPNNPPTVNFNADHITSSESFKYKISITGKTSNVNEEDGKDTEQGNTNTKRNLEIVVP